MATKRTKSAPAGPGEGSQGDAISPLRLRLGVAIVAFWWLPLWALAPAVSDALGGQPSTQSLTVGIVIVQTLVGVLGSWLAGTAVKSMLLGKPKNLAFGTIWYLLIHGRMREEPLG